MKTPTIHEPRHYTCLRAASRKLLAAIAASHPDHIKSKED